MQRRSKSLLIGAALATVGCACAGPGTSSKQTTAAGRKEICTSRMYAARAGHNDPNWSIYDYCMKHPD
ncbi:MAG TPA: hypothetical protein VMK05_16700 [Burkholderiales bacterium]|nr:hypothetical protein [Burkholderiales bacterium]